MDNLGFAYLSFAPALFQRVLNVPHLEELQFSPPASEIAHQ
jgi:hypothetical protein